MSFHLLMAIVSAGSMFNIDPALIQAVIKVESNGNPRAVGGVGEIGLMQVRPEYARVSKAKLFDAKHNVFEGTRILAENRENCVFKDDLLFVICYNKGSEGAKKIKHPKQDKYYLKVLKEYKNIKEQKYGTR